MPDWTPEREAEALAKPVWWECSQSAGVVRTRDLHDCIAALQAARAEVARLTPPDTRREALATLSDEELAAVSEVAKRAVSAAANAFDRCCKELCVRRLERQAEATKGHEDA